MRPSRQRIVRRSSAQSSHFRFAPSAHAAAGLTGPRLRRISGDYVMAPGLTVEVLSLRRTDRPLGGSSGVMIRSRAKRHRRSRSGTPRSAAHDRRDEPLRVVVRICSPGRTRMVRAGSCRTESCATRGDSAVRVAIYARYSSTTSGTPRSRTNSACARSSQLVKAGRSYRSSPITRSPAPHYFAPASRR